MSDFPSDEKAYQIMATGKSGTDDSRGNKSSHGLVSSSSVGSANRGRILQALFDLGPTSRADLARYAGVNRATISGIIQPLIDQRILAEGNATPSNESGGKPARPLWFSNDAHPICAVLLMHDSVRSCLVSLNGVVSAQFSENIPRASASTETVINLVFKCISATLSASKQPVLGIGVAAIGMIDTDKGTIIHANELPVLDGFALRSELVAKYGLPTCIDHHPRALLVGDRWFGLGRGRRNFAAIYTGDVLGGALFIDGHLFRGPAGAGGELGHTFVQIGGRKCKCGRIGCWETIATLGWLREESVRLDLPGAPEMTSNSLRLLVEQGLPEAVDLHDRYAFNVAVGIANLQQVMAPNFIVLHGDVVDGGSEFVAAVARHLGSLLPKRTGEDIELALGENEEIAALLGAAGLVLSELLHFPI